MADEKDEIAAWAVSKWMKVSTTSSAIAINPQLVEQIKLMEDGAFWFQLSSGDMVQGHVSARLLETEGTIFHDLKQEAGNG